MTQRIDFPHYILDFKAAAGELNNPCFIDQILIDVVKIAGMRIKLGPFTYKTPADGPWGKATGLTGFIVLHQSHALIHTFAEQGWVLFDLCSCNEFDQGRIYSYMYGQFDIQEVYRNEVLDRYTTLKSVEGGKDA